jgi:hypothetical protein
MPTKSRPAPLKVPVATFHVSAISRFHWATVNFVGYPANMAELTVGYVAGLISLGVFIGVWS